MKKHIKKLLLVGLLLSLSISVKAAFTFSLTVQPGTTTNLFPTFNNPFKVATVTIAATAGQSGIVAIYDAPTNVNGPFWQSGMLPFTFTNAPYTNYTYVVSNYWTTYTNYYGLVSYSYTNVALIRQTNSAPVVTNTYNAWLFVQATNGTANTYTGLSALYNYGMWATNSGTGPATITFTGQ